MLFDITIVIGLILANAVFTISDMAVIASKKTRLNALLEDGKENARRVMQLVDDPTPVIATTQIGLTVITMMEGAFVEASLSGKVAAYFISSGLFMGFEHTAASVVVFVLVTFFLLLIGDILPKRIAILYPETVSTFLMPLIGITIKILYPLISSFSFLSDAILRFFGLSTKRDESVSEEDIETMFEAGSQSGVLAGAERELFENVWKLDESKVGSLMTPRSEIIYIDITASGEENLEKILLNPSQNLLICKDSLDHVLGYAPAINVIRSIVQQFKDNGLVIQTSWTDGLKPIHAIPNTLTLIEMLEAFRTYKSHLALVYNEYGHVDGLVTAGDLVTAVMGDMQYLTDDKLLIEKDNSGKWLVDGQAPINDLLEELNIEEDDEDGSGYQTAAGLVISVIGKRDGRLPKVFDKFEYGKYLFEVVDIDRDSGYRVDKIMVRLNEDVANLKIHDGELIG